MIEVRESLAESHVASPEAVAVIRHSVVEFARASGIIGEKLDGVRVAVSEAVTNVVLHAYRSEPGQVHVTVRVVDSELWVLITDDGCGHNIPTERPGLGWGLAIITDACDEFTLVERATGGTEARMLFSIPAVSRSITRADQ